MWDQFYDSNCEPVEIMCHMCVFGWTEVNYWTIIWKPELETTASAFSLDKDITEMLCLIQE